MKLNTMRKLGLAGALATAGLLLAPLAASADVNKCSKELTKNAAKVTTDVQKELAKCVDGWLKDEDGVEANAGKDKYSFDGVTGNSSKLNKAAEKCQKSLVKIQTWGSDVSAGGDQEKTKLGKSYNKLLAAVTAGKPKCGVANKVFDTTPGGALDQELAQLGFFAPSTATGMDSIDVRLMVMGGFANAWSTQLTLNRDSYRAIQAAGNNRCAVSGILCDDVADCDPGDTLDVCSPSQCPDCIKFARAVDVTTAPGTETCADNSPCDGVLAPPCSGVVCTADTDCELVDDPATDLCDTAPSQGAIAGPCYMASCQSGDPGTNASVINLEGALKVGSLITFACDDGGCPFGAPVTVSLAGDHPTFLCDVQEILPDAVAFVAGAGRGITAQVTLTTSPVCVDSTGYTGYIDKLNTYPQFDVQACADVDDAQDLSGAGSADGCGTSQLCRSEPVDFPPGTLHHTGSICQDMVAAATPAAGHGIIRNDQILTTGTQPTTNPCDPAARIAAGEPSPLVLTTHTASGDLWDLGPITTGLPQPIIFPGPLHFTNSATGAPFDAAALAGGSLDGQMVSSFSTIATDPAATIGAQITSVVLDCNP